MARNHIEPGPELLKRIERAAQMRAAGCSWATIARKLNCHARTPSNWVSRHPAIWAQLYAAALAERDEDAEAESIRTLRDMLRVNDAKVQRDAARELLRIIRAGDKRRRAVQVDHPFGSLTHEALEQIIRAFDADAETTAGPDPKPAEPGPG